MIWFWSETYIKTNLNFQHIGVITLYLPASSGNTSFMMNLKLSPWASIENSPSSRLTSSQSFDSSFSLNGTSFVASNIFWNLKINPRVIWVYINKEAQWNYKPVIIIECLMSFIQSSWIIQLVSDWARLLVTNWYRTLDRTVDWRREPI